MSVHDEVEAVVGNDPRSEALQLLDGAWIDALRSVRSVGTAAAQDELRRQMQVDAAQIAALLYIGDQVKALREDFERGRL